MDTSTRYVRVKAPKRIPPPERKNKRQELPEDYDPTLVYNSIALTFMRDRVKAGYSPVMLVVGAPRSGKSLTAIDIAMKLAKTLRWKFMLEDTYFFGLEKFMDAFKSLRGRIIIIDEIGMDMDAHEWFSDFNKCFNYLIQTQAYKTNIYILVVPYAGYVARVHIPMIDLIGEKLGRTRISYYRVSPQYASVKAAKFIFSRYWETIKDIMLPPEYMVKAYKKLERKNKLILEDRILDVIKKRKNKGMSNDRPPLPGSKPGGSSEE